MVSEIHISTADRSAQKVSTETLTEAVSLLNENGYLVLHNAVATPPLEALKDIYDLAWKSFKERKPTWIAGGQIIGHLNVTPPVSKHFANNEILGNKIVNSITSSVLGPNLWIREVGGNTNEPNSVDQYFHSDVDYKDNTKLLVNIPLGDVDEKNGSIELVPKSHTSDCHFPDSNDLRAASSPVRINTKIGSVKWSWFLGQVCGLAKMHRFSVHAAFRICALQKYALSGVRLSSAVCGRSEL